MRRARPGEYLPSTRTERPNPSRFGFLQRGARRGDRALGRLDDAERMQSALAEDNRAAGEEDGYVYEELAELRLARGDAAGAAPPAAMAAALLREDAWLAATEPARLERLAQLGAGEAAPPAPKLP